MASYIWLPQRLSDTVRAPPREKPALGDLASGPSPRRTQGHRPKTKDLTEIWTDGSPAVVNAGLRLMTNEDPNQRLSGRGQRKTKPPKIPPLLLIKLRTQIPESSMRGLPNQAQGLFPVSIHSRRFQKIREHPRMFSPGFTHSDPWSSLPPPEVTRKFDRRSPTLQDKDNS
jgi:hypothetical protein